MENQKQTQQARQNLKIERWKKIIAGLTQKKDKGVLTPWERYTLERTKTALENQIKLQNMTDEEWAEKNAERRKKIEIMDFLYPDRREKRLADQRRRNKELMEIANERSLANGEKTNANSKNTRTRKRKTAQSNVVSATVSNPNNSENISTNASSTTGNIDGDDSEIQSYRNLHCPSSDIETDNHTNRFLLDESDLVSSTNSTEVPQNQEAWSASSSQTETDSGEKNTNAFNNTLESHDITSNQTSQNEPPCKQFYKPKLRWLNRLLEQTQSINQNTNNEAPTSKKILTNETPASTRLSQIKYQIAEGLAGTNASNPYQAFLAQQSVIKTKVAAACTNSKTKYTYPDHYQSLAKEKFNKLLDSNNNLEDISLLTNTNILSRPDNEQIPDDALQKQSNLEPQFS